jgi:hypothetical protein
MTNWDNFYMLIGSTAGTLVGLIFVVVSLGADHAKSSDEDRTRIFVTPVLVHFASLLLIALAVLAPVSNVPLFLALSDARDSLMWPILRCSPGSGSGRRSANSSGTLSCRLWPMCAS